MYKPKEPTSFSKLKYEFGKALTYINLDGYLRYGPEYTVVVFNNNSTDVILDIKIPPIQSVPEIIDYLKQVYPEVFL